MALLQAQAWSGRCIQHPHRQRSITQAQRSFTTVQRCSLCRLAKPQNRKHGIVVASQPDTEEARSPLEAPQEWEAPAPSKRPDIFPEFEKLDRVILPKPLPGDPEMPDEEEEEAKKRVQPGDPDPEGKPGEPDEPEPGDPGSEPEKEPNIPSIPD